MENLTGTRFDDLLWGNSGANRLDGGAGDDRISGAGGNDTLLGGAGDDLFFFESGLDVMDGGTGTDTVEFSGFSFAVWVDLAYASGPYEAWTLNSGNTFTGTWRTIADLTSVENLTGTRFDDSLWGNAGANHIAGGAGHDRLSGAGGNDTVIGGAGNDTLFYEAGLDVLDGGADTDTVDFSGFGFAVWVDFGTAGTHEAWTLNSSHTWSGTWQRIADFTSIENLNGTRFDDLVQGNAAANQIDGGAGSDTLRGEGGADVLIGGAGADTLTGGAGSDRFDYNHITHGNDTITDFARGTSGDKLDIRDVLVGYNPGSSNINSFVRLTGTSSTTVSVNADGAGSDFVALATLQNVAMSASLLNEMLANGNLIVS
jgi:Ca2+-binding RTX toxin-like protein